MAARQQLCSEEQLSQLLLRLAAAPDLSLFRDKHERLASLENRMCFSMRMDEQRLVQFAAALSRGLTLLVPLLLLDLPKRALYSIGSLQRLLGDVQIALHNPMRTDIEGQLTRRRLAADGIADTGKMRSAPCGSWSN
jgi:hypothetical protein